VVVLGGATYSFHRYIWCLTNFVSVFVGLVVIAIVKIIEKIKKNYYHHHAGSS
jgi:hypothetical protein